MTKGQGQLLDIPLIHNLYTAYQTWHELLVRFPKSQRYALGNQCQLQLLALLEHVITAASEFEPEAKRRSLRQASIKLDLLKLLVRLSKDTKCITNQAYLDMQSRLFEAGKMLGGWLKSVS